MTIENVMKLLKCFPRSYMNHFGECVLCEKGNLYITVKNCETETDIKCKLLEWCSRSAGKGEPYKTEKKNIEFRQFVTNGINIYLGTDFTIEDMYCIYDKLGNAINHQLTLDFIANGYDMEFLKRSDEEMTVKERYFLVTDGIIEMDCVANSYEEATNLFLDYLKNRNDDCIYELQGSGKIYEYSGTDLKTVHFIFNQHYIDVLRSKR